MGESKARDPLVEEPRGWIALGAAGRHSLREGMCCEERSSCDGQRAPSAKKVCVTVRHTQTQLITPSVTHTQAQRSVARTVCCLSDCPRRAQPCLKFQWFLQPQSVAFATPSARGRAPVVLPTGSYR